MKKQPIITIVLLFIMTSFAQATESTEALTTKEVNQRAEVIVNRVKEIESIDKSTLTRIEKKTLKAELKDLKKEAKEMGLDSRISISIGALIIIILLLILIL